MVTISHVWPGYTLLNIWDLTYRDWAYLRSACDEYERQTAAANRR